MIKYAHLSTSINNLLKGPGPDSGGADGAGEHSTAEAGAAGGDPAPAGGAQRSHERGGGSGGQ